MAKRRIGSRKVNNKPRHPIDNGGVITAKMEREIARQNAGVTGALRVSNNARQALAKKGLFGGFA